MRLLILLAAALLLGGCRKTIHEANAPALHQQQQEPYTSGATFSI
jgi:uncharacterized lipoprotein YajG